VQLVINLLRGLNARFATTADIIANTTPLPDFKSATNMLRVKELRLGTEQKAASASALVVSTASSCTSPSCHSISSTSNSGGGGKGKGGKSKDGRGGNGGSGSSNNNGNGGRRNQQHGGGRQASSPAGPWVCYPWVDPWSAPGGQWPPQ
jgi:hypothetical protein